MADLPITIACGDYDRTRAIKDGDVRVEGCDVTYLALGPEEIFFRAFRQQEFDVSELSFSTYMMATARGDCPYIAIPVFVSRAFRHSGYLRSYGQRHRGARRPQGPRCRRARISGHGGGLDSRASSSMSTASSRPPFGGGPAGSRHPGRHEKVDLAVPKDVALKAIPT